MLTDEFLFESSEVNLLSKKIQLLRYDDSWRPLIGAGVPSIKKLPGSIKWTEAWGGPDAYGHPAADMIKPLDFDAWGDPNTHVAVNPINFSGELKVEPVTYNDQPGFKFQIMLQDLRDNGHPLQTMLEIPVGFKLPYKKKTRAFGLKEMYLEPEIINCRVDSDSFPNEWFYMESELFGKICRHPMDGIGCRKEEWGRRIHCGAPMAVFQESEGEAWWALSGEPDYGAAVQWLENEVIIYTTLYLKPGGSAEWQSCLWTQIEEEPENVYLTATAPGGFYDQMNPPGMIRKGLPEGPITFININRPEAQLRELEKVQPKMVILNYIYDHVSCVANMYGSWQTYEGFTMNEEKLKRLIGRIKSMGARVGFYGTSVEQPESHKVLKQSDIVLDKWGRRFNAWEPGNWVIDAGNEDCADRLARAEAEFAKYYGFECVFVDRLDHLSVNANPDRRGAQGNQRLENIPSVRLGVIELNKKRVEWQRKLNPELYIGLNNTTQWIGGVRYSDFNLLEGGMDLQPPIFFLNAPQGLVHKQHYNVFFCDVDGDVVDHGIIQGEEQLSGFNIKRRALFLDALADGVMPEPYEDEIFVAPESQFFKGWNNRELPDDDKWSFYSGKNFYGGDLWREDEDSIARAMEVANEYCFPVEHIWHRPDGLHQSLRFSARRGFRGGYYIGIRNEGEQLQAVDFEIDGLRCRGEIEPGCVRAWFCCSSDAELETIYMKAL